MIIRIVLSHLVQPLACFHHGGHEEGGGYQTLHLTKFLPKLQDRGLLDTTQVLFGSGMSAFGELS